MTKKTTPAVLLGVLWACSMGLHAEPLPSYPDLPPLAQVSVALATYPTVLAAKAGIQLEEANRDRLLAGSYEFTVRLGTQRRQVTSPDERFNEWDLGLERPLRLPNKARLDAEIAQQGVAQVHFAYEDALHEAGRILLRAWFVWLREQAQVQQWTHQTGLLKEQLAAVNKRVRAGDAPKLEAGLAEATLAQASAALKQALARQRIAANDITLRFTGIALPAQPTFAAPQPLEHDQNYWHEQTLTHNHELSLARAETMRAQLIANRMRADRQPDPTLGAHYASERNGVERVAGITVSIPLPGAARAAVASAAQASSAAAAEREAGVLRRLGAEAANNFAQAQSAYDSWQSMTLAADRIERNADLVARAYSLGEAGLADVLTARRLAIESRLSAALAQLDAQEARYRLMLDAEQLWSLESPDQTSVHHHS